MSKLAVRFFYNKTTSTFTCRSKYTRKCFPYDYELGGQRATTGTARNTEETMLKFIHKKKKLC
jgi:hypothetical protein